MSATNDFPQRFLMSTESELLTVIEGETTHDPGQALARLLEVCGRLAPTANSQLGLFNGYGRTYNDGGHLELAAAECDNPFTLISMMQRQQTLLVQSLEQLRSEGITITLANCNHSGLLTDNAATWGAHENYLVHIPPKDLADLMLPFLATRSYTGAGGVHFPSGTYLASVRHHFMNRDRGGGTTSDRALHSTARGEHLTTNPSRYGYRYHLISGDGLRSQFSQFLRVGTTALVLRMLEWEASDSETQGESTRQRIEQLPTDGNSGPRAFWMRAMHQFNRLSQPGELPKVDRLVWKVQRFYLRQCDRFYSAHSNLPNWVGQVLAVWESTLNALQRRDEDWLTERLDPWIKHRLMSDFLKTLGQRWVDIPNNLELGERLALLNQDYHDFTSPKGLFQQLESQGRLRQRIVDDVTPGEEPEPFVPETGTRATARARFLREHDTHPGLLASRHVEVDWSTMFDAQNRRVWLLDDPFASKYQEISPSH